MMLELGAESDSHLRLTGEQPWRCVKCGNVVDAVILQNRAVGRPPIAAAA
jgi:hypothetical protein